MVTGVVVTGPFIKKLLHNHFMTEIFFKKKPGNVNDEVKFPFFFLLHKRDKPILPLPSPSPPRVNSNPFLPPLPSPSPPRANSNPLLPPYPPTTLNPFLCPPIRNQPSTLLSVACSKQARAFRVTYERQSVLNRSQKNPPSKSAACITMHWSRDHCIVMRAAAVEHAHSHPSTLFAIETRNALVRIVRAALVYVDIDPFEVRACGHFDSACGKTIHTHTRTHTHTHIIYPHSHLPV